MSLGKQSSTIRKNVAPPSAGSNTAWRPGIL